jgi:type 2 lantibiotic biosynthesis protein LanM
MVSKALIEIVEKASTITERLDSKFVFNEEKTSQSLLNSRIQQWCQVVAQGNWQQFEKRLAWDGLNLRTVCFALGSVSINNYQNLPTWTKTLDDCMKGLEVLDYKTLEKVKKNRFLDIQEPIAFEEVWLTFIYVARQKLVAQAKSSYHLLSEKAHAYLERCLLKQISLISSPTMELEFSIFRTCRKITLLRKSDRSYSNEQYKTFIRELLEGGLLGFFLEYPVLARLVATITDFWIDSNADFISRLASDWIEIEKTFQPYTKLGKVIAVEPELSDPHHSGRFVMMVTFASGFKLVYKPRNIDIEKAYLNLLVWINKQGVSLDFKLFKLINKGKYGWVEFVEASHCENQQEVRRYYQRSGMLLCLMHILGATDLHYENIIACGEYPVLIDMETLMHPYPKEVDEINTANKVQYLFHQKILHSVLRTGLLPQWQFTSIDQSYDLSGLGGSVKQKTFFRVPKWLDINTDNMLMSYEYDVIEKNINMSSWDRDELALNNYQEEIVEGFRYMYIFLMKHQATILDMDNPFTTLAHQSVRFIFRPTKTYSFLLKRTLDPKFLRDGADRSIQLDLLSRVMLLSNNKPLFWPLVKVEKKALEQMDTPIFTTCSDSDSLNIDLYQTVKKCFAESGFDLFVSRLKQLNNQDLEEQIYFIRSSLRARIAEDLHSAKSSEKIEIKSDLKDYLTQDKILQQAIEITTEQQRLAIVSTDGSATWVALQYLMEAQRFQLQSIYRV